MHRVEWDACCTYFEPRLDVEGTPQIEMWITCGDYDQGKTIHLYPDEVRNWAEAMLATLEEAKEL